MLDRIHQCSNRFVSRSTEADPSGSAQVASGSSSPFPASSSLFDSDYPSSSLGHYSFSWLDTNPFAPLAGLTGTDTNSDSGLPAGTYGQSFAAVAVPILADRIALPPKAGKVAMLDVLPEALRGYYLDPRQCLAEYAAKKVEVLTDGTPRAVPKPLPKPKVFGKATEYHKLLLRLIDSEMIMFTTTPAVVNGLSATKKPNGDQRLIIDARWTNRLFVEPPHVELPTPDLFARLVVPPPAPGQARTKVWVAKTDLSDYYYNIAIPEWMIPYFALPPVLVDLLIAHRPSAVAGFAAGTMIYPCLRVLAMGWSHSVRVAQSAHTNLLDTRTTSCTARDRIVNGGDLRLETLEQPKGERVVHAVYIDDVVFFGTDRDRVGAAQDEYLSTMATENLHAKPTKVVRPTSSGVEGLGVVINGDDHTVGVSPAKLRRLCDATCSLLKQECATGLEMARCVGKWTWVVLVTRPAL
jgi:hypothetical protein